MRLDAAAFGLLQRKRRFKPQSLEIAKRRIIDEEPAAALAVAYGVNLQRIYAIERQIITAWQELHLPPGWAEITLAAPKPLINEFKRRALEAKEELLRENERKIQAPRRRKPELVK